MSTSSMARAPKGGTRGQPRLNPSVALSKCTPWVLNCEHAGFGFVDTTLAKLRQKVGEQESVAGAISTPFFSHVKTHGILRNQDAPEISRPLGLPNQADVLVNGLG